MGRLSLDESLVSQNDLERRLDRRRYFEKLRMRSEMLIGKERVMMKMYLDGSCNFSELGQLLGVNESSVSRKINAIIKRLLRVDDIALIRNSGEFSFIDEAIGRDYFICGLTQNQISEKRMCSVYKVKKTLNQIQRFIDKQKESQYRSLDEKQREERRYDPDFQC